MTPENFATRNMHGVVSSVSQVYELTRELKRDHLHSLGLGSNRLVNMVLAEEAIIAQDLKMRKNEQSPSGECLGILRMNNWCNGVDICLWNFKRLVLLGQLSQSGRLVAHMDGTKF